MSGLPSDLATDVLKVLAARYPDYVTESDVLKVIQEQQQGNPLQWGNSVQPLQVRQAVHYLKEKGLVTTRAFIGSAATMAKINAAGIDHLRDSLRRGHWG